MTPFLRAAIATMLPHASTDGCAECGFDWTLPTSTCRDVIDGAPDRLGALLAGHRAPAPDAGWSPSAYVWHVGDVVRAWAERLHALGADPTARWAGFDPDELARARIYGDLPAVTAAWALDQATQALTAALEPLDVVATFTHPEWGEGTVADALRWLAHEAVHHELDVRRGLGLT
jgi:hypothetical protein